VRHANDFNGFTLEILACLDAIREIARWRMAGPSVGIIAEKLGRHRSTIFREIKRNTFVDKVGMSECAV
jgi:IS30 family transposase